ncbi:MAG: hypothetical protein D6734_01045 [Candidatus Schekmanbacteria bacterium]|nr:MAG: hypothetical protein D6734_01045 [Candidatus Schekmanbacteria bacterium]
MKLRYEIKPENLKVLEIKKIALNKDKFGALTFDKAYPQLHKLRKMLVEFEELDYQNLLTSDEVREVDSIKQRLMNYIKRINDLNPETDASFNKNVRDQIESEIDSFYRTATRQLRSNLVFLRQEAARKSQDQQSLAEEQRAAMQARKQYEELHKQLKGELELLQKQKGEIEKAHGEIASKYLAAQFNKQAKEYEDEAKKWLLLRNRLYWVLICIIGLNFLAYLSLFILDKGWNIGLPPREIFTVEYGLVKLALLAVISYGIGFASKNYNVNSHLSAINKHRRNVAQTLEDFLATNPDRKTEMLRQATEAMFRHVSIGYIRREKQKDNGPIYEIINKFLPNKEQ